MKIIDIIKEDEQPTGEYRLIRVVPSVDNIVREPDGTLSIRQQQGSSRGTVHWTMNSTVGSHTLGNWDKSGFVIIADPKDIKAPLLGARPDDTWYALDKNNKLNIGRAQILAPQGAEVPKGLPVNYYSGDRSQAVKQALTKQGVHYMGITGAQGAGDLSFNDFHKMGRDFAAKHGNQGPGSTDLHMNTLHSRAEGVVKGVNYRIDQMKAGKEFEADFNRRDIYQPTEAREFIDRFRKDLAKYQRQNPKAAAYEADYFNKINRELDSALKQIDVLDAKFQADRAARIAARKKAALAPPPPPGQSMSSTGGSIDRPPTGLGSRPMPGPTMGSTRGMPSTSDILRQMNPNKLM